MNPSQKYLAVSFVLVISLLVMAQEAQATLTVAATPRRGGQNIRFEESKPGTLLRNEEVTVSVDSTEAAAYVISQTIYQPLNNERGDVIPQDRFIEFSPSQTLGALLRIENET